MIQGADAESMALTATLIGIMALLSAYLVGAVLVACACAAGRRTRAIRLLERMTPAVLRRTVAWSIGVAAALGPSTTGASGPGPQETAVMRSLEAPSPIIPSTQVGVPHEVATPPARSHTIAPGEHLWGVAEADLAAIIGTAPSDAEILAHVEALVALNAEVLVVPGEPDLVLPGQVFELPQPRWS